MTGGTIEGSCASMACDGMIRRDAAKVAAAAVCCLWAWWVESVTHPIALPYDQPCNVPDHNVASIKLMGGTSEASGNRWEILVPVTSLR